MSETESLNQDLQNAQAQIIVSVNYEIFLMGLAALQLVNSVLLVTVTDGPSRQLVAICFGVVAIFLVLNAISRAWRRGRGRLPGGLGWLELLGSLPLPFFTVLRLLRVAIITRQLRRADVETARTNVVRRRAGGLLLLALLAAMIVLEFGALAVLHIEDDAAGANIRTPSDALWWALVTVATVGYGDRFPVTTAGRLVGVVVMLVGVGLFSLLTSFLAQNFIKAGEERQEDRIRAMEMPDDDDLSTIRRLIDEQEAHHRQTMAELRARLDRLERGSRGAGEQG